MKKIFQQHQSAVLLVSVVFGAGILVFGRLAFTVEPDIRLKAYYIIQVAQGQAQLAQTFLYYLSVYCLSFFSTSLDHVLYVSVLVMSLALGAKYLVSYLIFSSWLNEALETGRSPMFKRTMALFAPLFLVFAHSLPAGNPLDRMYLGYIPPNVWHNPTIVFVMPFSLLLFWFSYRYLKRPTRRLALMMLFQAALIVVSKPSYLLVFVVAFPVFSFLRLGFGKIQIPAVFLTVLSACAIVVQIALLRFEVDFLPGGWWRYYGANPPYFFLTSLLFPLVYCALNFKRAAGDLAVQYTAFAFVIAFSISSLMVQRGAEADGNLVWQTFICVYMLFLAVLGSFCKKLLEKGRLTFSDKLVASVFAMHVMSGFFYLSGIVSRSKWV